MLECGNGALGKQFRIRVAPYIELRPSLPKTFNLLLSLPMTSFRKSPGSEICEERTERGLEGESPSVRTLSVKPPSGVILGLLAIGTASTHVAHRRFHENRDKQLAKKIDAKCSRVLTLGAL
ncbi:hypothetical protein AVEN_199880-1 [Araneus ventricosus]|uniref:Uncharacterized protein n=1 Tax=Araneus ventricosus TaxID=182803 RepID=A0A4Y2KFE9_ARAVE|nr:hypothetical protein AVEN_199880-1 [Araneus ventricosus]